MAPSHGTSWGGIYLPGFMATDSGSQFSSRDSMRLSDSGSAEEVEEYEIQGKRGWLHPTAGWGGGSTALLSLGLCLRGACLALANGPELGVELESQGPSKTGVRP